jgi:hypothetical protein
MAYKQRLMNNAMVIHGRVLLNGLAFAVATATPDGPCVQRKLEHHLLVPLYGMPIPFLEKESIFVSGTIHGSVPTDGKPRRHEF